MADCSKTIRNKALLDTITNKDSSDTTESRNSSSSDSTVSSILQNLVIIVIVILQNIFILAIVILHNIFIIIGYELQKNMQKCVVRENSKTVLCSKTDGNK